MNVFSTPSAKTTESTKVFLSYDPASGLFVQTTEPVRKAVQSTDEIGEQDDVNRVRTQIVHFLVMWLKLQTHE